MPLCYGRRHVVVGIAVVIVVAALAVGIVVVVFVPFEQGRKRKVSSLIVFYDKAVYNTVDQQRNALS